MRTELLEIKNSGVSDPILMYYAGVFKAYIDIETSQVFTFIKQIFENPVYSSQIDQIRNLLVSGDIGKIVEIIENFRCTLCRKIDKSLLKLTCGHLLHEKCLLDDISFKMMKGNYSCPTCQKIDPDVRNLNEKIRNLIKTQQIAMILENNSDMTICPSCSTICEIEEDLTKCFSCSLVFCSCCLEVEKTCICE